MSSKFPFSRETRRILAENRDFFGWFRINDSEPQLRLRVADSQAHTSRDMAPNGDVRIGFVFPIDDNDNPADGRLFLHDTFVFDPTERILKDFSFQVTGNAPDSWKELKLWQNAPQNALDLRIQKFAREVVPFHGRPLTAEMIRSLKGQVEYLQKGLDPITSYQPAWRLRMVDPQTHFMVGKRGAEASLQFYFVVDDDADPANGRMFWVEGFSLDSATGQIRSHERRWEAAPEIPQERKAGYEGRLDLLNRLTPGSPHEAQDFATAVLPKHLHTEPGSSRPFSEKEEWLQTQANLQRHATREGLEILQAHWQERNGKGLEGKAEAFASLFQKALDSVGADGGSSPLAVFAHLDLNPEERGWAQRIARDELSAQIDDVSREIGPLRAPHWLRLVRDELLKKEYGETAAFLLSKLKERPNLQEKPEVVAEIDRLTGVLTGKGNSTARAEFLLPKFAVQAASPYALAAWLLAPIGGSLLEAAVLSRTSRSLIGRGLAHLAGIAGEAASFSAAQNLLAVLASGQKARWNHFGEETLSAGLLFGLMRLSHGAVSQFSGMLSRGRLSSRFAVDDVVLHYPVAPTGRIATRGLRPGLTRAGERVVGTLYHAAGLGSMLAVNALSRNRRWKGDSGESTGALFDTTLEYAQAMVGFRLGHGLTGGAFLSAIAEARLRGQQRGRSRSNPPSSSSGNESKAQESHLAAEGESISRVFADANLPKPKWPRPIRRYKTVLTQLYGPEVAPTVGQNFAALYKHYPRLEPIFNPDRLNAPGINAQPHAFAEAKAYIEREGASASETGFSPWVILQEIEAARRPFEKASPEEGTAILKIFGPYLRQLFGNDASDGARHFATLFKNYPSLIGSFTPEKAVSWFPEHYQDMLTKGLESTAGWLTYEIVLGEARRETENLRDLAQTKKPLIAAEGWGIEEFRKRDERAWHLKSGWVHLGGRVPDAHIQLEDGWVSQRHFQIMGTSGNWFLQDLESKHGTQLDGERLMPNEPKPLTEGSRIMAGMLPYVFTILPDGDARLIVDLKNESEQPLIIEEDLTLVTDPPDFEEN